MSESSGETHLTPPLRLGTRASALARWQADWVAGQLRQAGFAVDIVPITTTGDVTSESLSQVGGQGIFTKEIQRALLDQRIDLAVHSLKDLPTDTIHELTLGAIPPRESPLDVLVSNKVSSLDQLPPQARVGTGSRRRQSQLLHYRADLQLSDIRGNVDTRLRKLDEGQFEAIILAEAGLNRLGLTRRIVQTLSPAIMLPAVGQGALGIEIRSNDETTAAAVRGLDDAATRAAVLAERQVLRQLRGGCLAPVGAWAKVEANVLRLSAAVLSLDGRRRVSVSLVSDAANPELLGSRAAEELLEMGAGEMIEASRSK